MAEHSEGTGKSLGRLVVKPADCPFFGVLMSRNLVVCLNRTRNEPP